MQMSWKLRAAVAGVAMAAAPIALIGPAGAVPGAPTVTSITPTNGPAGTAISVSGTACGSSTTPATSVALFLTGPAIPTPTATPGVLVPGSTSGDFTGSLTIPASARPGETYSVIARCTDGTGQGPNSSGGPTFTVADTGLTGAVTGALSSTTGGLTGGLSGVTGGVTGTTGSTTGTTAGGFTTGTTTGTTTGVAQPITQQPTFTG